MEYTNNNLIKYTTNNLIKFYNRILNHGINIEFKDDIPHKWIIKDDNNDKILFRLEFHNEEYIKFYPKENNIFTKHSYDSKNGMCLEQLHGKFPLAKNFNDDIILMVHSLMELFGENYNIVLEPLARYKNNNKIKIINGSIPNISGIKKKYQKEFVEKEKINNPNYLNQ
tara:strand:+ start:240 stop:746 length:507 start_codon:yes stop_codon:yes gene_type:complete